jgi:hypothetical protein
MQRGETMSALQVRDFPADLHERLRERARRDHRSVSQEATIAIGEFLAQHPDAHETYRDFSCDESIAEQRRRLFAEIDAMPVIDIPDDFPTPEQIIRELRDGR